MYVYISMYFTNIIMFYHSCRYYYRYCCYYYHYYNNINKIVYSEGKENPAYILK